MTETAFRGPLLSLGATLDTSSSPYDGPTMAYQGFGLIDPRLNNPAAKDSPSPGAIPGFMLGNIIQVIDNIPSLTSTTTIAAAQVATSGTALSLATAAVNGVVAGTPVSVPGVPLVPQGTSVATTAAFALDFGFTTGTTVANSSTVVVVDSSMFDQGQWIAIGGVGASGRYGTLLTQVQTTLNATTINISPVAGTAASNAPIGQANLFNTNLPAGSQFGPATASASGVSPYRIGGFGLYFDPMQALSRNITVSAASTEGGTSALLVSGWDVYGQPMTELITASGTTVVGGKKAFKYISTIVPQSNGSSAYTVGVGDIVGLPVRVDRFGSLNRVTMGNNAMATAAGFTSAITSAANNTSGDVRGTLAVNLLGGAIGTSNNTSRLTVSVTMPLLQMLEATPANSSSLLGVTQA